MNKKISLIKKEKLTGDVFELVFLSSEKLLFSPGQFITFILPSGLRRAYSISYSDGIYFEFLIKREENGRGGSKEICDLDIGLSLDFIGPVGNFILKQTKNNKLFIGTGTGFAPLYFQIKCLLENNYEKSLFLVFGVRYKKDLFYEEVLKKLKEIYSNFSYRIYLSREDNFDYYKGYVSDFLTKDSIFNFDEFYICGGPNVVGSVIKKLEDYDISKENIFFDQY